MNFSFFIFLVDGRDNNCPIVLIVYPNYDIHTVHRFDIYDFIIDIFIYLIYVSPLFIFLNTFIPINVLVVSTLPLSIRYFYYHIFLDSLDTVILSVRYFNFQDT